MRSSSLLLMSLKLFPKRGKMPTDGAWICSFVSRNGKTPGPSRLSTEFYTAFKNRQNLSWLQGWGTCACPSSTPSLPSSKNHMRFYSCLYQQGEGYTELGSIFARLSHHFDSSGGERGDFRRGSNRGTHLQPQHWGSGGRRVRRLKDSFHHTVWGYIKLCFQKQNKINNYDLHLHYWRSQNFQSPNVSHARRLGPQLDPER